MFLSPEYSAFSVSDMRPQHAEKKSAEKLYMNGSEKLTNATTIAYQNYQAAVEQRRRTEQKRRWEVGLLHQALGAFVQKLISYNPRNKTMLCFSSI